MLLRQELKKLKELYSENQCQFSIEAVEQAINGAIEYKNIDFFAFFSNKILPKMLDDLETVMIYKDFFSFLSKYREIYEFYGSSPLHWAVDIAIKHNTLEVIMYLIQNAFLDIDIQDKKGKTPRAILRGYFLQS